ncbi:unnamed protein product [Mucor hiemalis]
MTTMNLNSRQSFVYPHFHDTQSARKTAKDIEIDKSVYHLLSLYLNADALEKMSPSTPNLHHIKKHSNTQSPYWRSNWKSDRTRVTHRNWFGEEEKVQTITRSPQDILLANNTLKNATTPLFNDESMTNRKTRSKSVSFNETVVIIISHDEKSVSKLKQAALLRETATEDEDDESLFVDAVESFDNESIS